MIDQITIPVCPRCNGAGYGEGFITHSDGCSFGRITCSVCMGTGKVAPMVLERMRVGEIMRQERMNQNRSGREEANRIGADMITLNHLEHGRSDILHKFKEFRQDGWPYCPNCEEEELYSNAGLTYAGTEPKPTLAQHYLSGFGCYRCNWKS